MTNNSSQWRYLLGYLIAATVIIVCLGLAVWQLQRAQQKQEILQSLPDAYYSVEGSLELLHTQPKSSLHGSKLLLNGRLDPANLWFLDNQIVNARVGVDVLGLFKVPGLEPLLLVNLGFIEMSKRVVPHIRLPKNELQLEVIVKTEALKGFTLASKPNLDTSQPNLVQYVDISYLSEQIGEEIYPAVFYQQNKPALVAEPHYQPVVMPPQKHQAYALQWFLLACAAGIVALKLNKRREIHA